MPISGQRQVGKSPHVQPNQSRRDVTYRVMRGKHAWGILGYGFIGNKAAKTQRFFYILALNDMLALIAKNDGITNFTDW